MAFAITTANKNTTVTQIEYGAGPDNSRVKMSEQIHRVLLWVVDDSDSISVIVHKNGGDLQRINNIHKPVLNNYNEVNTAYQINES